jgi:hypothetical protein
MQHYLTDGRLIRITMDDGGQMNVPFQKGQVPNPSFGGGQQPQASMGDQSMGMPAQSAPVQMPSMPPEGAQFNG